MSSVQNAANSEHTALTKKKDEAICVPLYADGQYAGGQSVSQSLRHTRLPSHESHQGNEMLLGQLTLSW